MAQTIITAEKSLKKPKNEPVVEVIDPEALRARMLRPLPEFTWRGLAIFLLIVAVLSWSLAGTQTNVNEFIKGLPALGNFISRLFPPTFELARGTAVTYEIFGNPVTLGWPRIISAVVETIQMALIGTIGAIILSIPISLLAARNIAPRGVYVVTRLILNAMRSIPELIWGLIFVAAVGLGPFPGVLALVFGSIGSLSRIFAEAIEQIDPQQVKAVQATGAGGISVFVYAVLPQALPLLISYSLIYFESNVRNATILGYVGAGGVGFEIQKYMALFQYDRMMGTVIVLVIAVTVLDRFSSSIRSRFI